MTAMTDVSDYITTVAQWLTALGVNPNAVPVDSDLYITGEGHDRVLHYEQLVRSPNGCFLTLATGERVAEPHTALLTVEPPATWQPVQKPTREALLAALERVRNELDRMAALPVVTEDTTRADRFAVGARWAIRMVRENALDEVLPRG